MTTAKRLQKGFTLTEALVAFAIVGVGLLAVATFQSGLFKESGYNKARTEALALAQEKLEQFKHFTRAEEESYIDDNNDGVMDANGNYAENPIEGRNAVFTRSWQLGTTNVGRDVAVSVSWNDADNQLQTVSLTADIPWISPRTAADQVAVPADPLVDSPTGRARRGEGKLADLPSGDLVSFPNIYPDDGMEMYQYKDDLLLVNAEGDIVLTLLDACTTESGQCKDFVRIKGRVYLDTANTRMPLDDIELLASDAAYCQRWVPEGTLLRPPTTDKGDYEYYNYTCFLGGGWHGNIGFVTKRGLRLTDKVCQGDPTAFESYKQPVIAMRRAYRGMISKTVNGTTKYYSHGVRDASVISGQDYVFTAMSTDTTQGSACMTVDAPMTRADSKSGRLFREVPTDFVCLNQDFDGDGSSEYLDEFDTSVFSAAMTCPFDPTSPPAVSHTVSGTVTVYSSLGLDLSAFEVLTSDGPGNCEVWPVGTTAGDSTLAYSCKVFDWGSGWTGNVLIQPNSPRLFCATKFSAFSNLMVDASENFSCRGVSTVAVEGSINYLTKNAEVQALTVEDYSSGLFGECEFISTVYRCIVPYDGSALTGGLTVTSAGFVCNSTDNVVPLYNLTADGSPYRFDITIVNAPSNCPIVPEPYPMPIETLDPTL